MFIINNKTNTISVEWNLNESKPEWHDDIGSLSASEIELSHIQRYFRGIPTVMQKDIVTWHGDVAKFIFENL